MVSYSTWNHLAPHQILLGMGGSGSRRRARARAMVIVHWGLSPLRGHLHLQQSCSVLTGQLSSAAAAALSTVGFTTSVLSLSSVPQQLCCHKCPRPGFALPHLKPVRAEELFHHVLEGDVSPGGFQLDLSIWLLLPSLLLLLPFPIVVAPLHGVIAHHREVLQVPGHGSGSSWHHPANV